MRKMLKPSGRFNFRLTNFTLFFALGLGSNGRGHFMDVFNNSVNPRKVFLIMISRLTYFDYIELMPRFSCTIPTIPWFRPPEQRIPENFKENRKWDVTILKVSRVPSNGENYKTYQNSSIQFGSKESFKSIFKLYDLVLIGSYVKNYIKAKYEKAYS